MQGSNQAASNGIENPNIPLEISMSKELDSLSPVSSLRCIYRVPPQLRRVCENAYTPRAISIGPLHHGKKELKAMEEHKKRYLQNFTLRTGVSLKDYIVKIKNQEAKLRSCYTETIEFKSDEFVRIILVDAAFTVEFLLRCWYKDFLAENDCIFGRPNMIVDLRPDMLLFENQLPFFILEDLLNSNSQRLSILRLSYHFLKVYNLIRDIEGTEDNFQRICSSGVKVEHLVDLLRMLYAAPLWKSPAIRPCEVVNKASVRELHRAGVKFKVMSNESLLNIHFNDGILEIPKWEIDDSTESIIRNMVAFEQCHGRYMDNYLSDYLILMDQFVNTPRDVELLSKCGIFENMLGDNSAVSNMINSIGNGVVIHCHKFHYSTLREDLNKYSSLTWHKWRANLRQNYFNTPWATISAIAAGFLVIFTLIQTVFSIISAT